MAASVSEDRRQAGMRGYEVLADEIIAEMPDRAEARNISPGRVALAVWLALYCDLLGDEWTSEALFDLARKAAADHAARESCET